MALTVGFNVKRRGTARGTNFGYAVLATDQVFRGSLICLNSAGTLQRLQTTGSVAFAGISDRDLNPATVPPPPENIVIAERGCFQLTVTGATAANVGAAVYATDDNSLQLTVPATGFLGTVGTLVGIENGQTWVLLAGG